MDAQRTNSRTAGIVQCGRKVSAEEIAHVREVVELVSGLSRTELTHTLCDHLGWVTASGQHKMAACSKLLERLEELGVIRLPGKRDLGPGRSREKSLTARTAPSAEVCGELGDLGPVRLERVSGGERTALWNEYVERHHPLGYRRPFGCTLRYFIESSCGLLGCVLLAGAARAIAVRDEWIGWTESLRLRNLPWVINNSRFLIFPWVKVKHLASHVLGQLARRVEQDWAECWGYRPVLMETFVDPLHFQGVCYQAAGWTLLGQTTGRGLRRPGRHYNSTPKLVFVRPLVRDFRAGLCSKALVGRAWE